MREGGQRDYCSWLSSCNIRHKIRSSKVHWCLPIPFDTKVQPHSLIQPLPNPGRGFHISHHPKILLEALNISGPILRHSPVWSTKLVLLWLSHLRYLLGQPVSECATKAGFTKDAEEADPFSAVSQEPSFELSPRVIVYCPARQDLSLVLSVPRGGPYTCDQSGWAALSSFCHIYNTDILESREWEKRLNTTILELAKSWCGCKIIVSI